MLSRKRRRNRSLTGLLRQDDDPRAGQVAEVDVIAVLRHGHGDVLASALQLGLADETKEITLGREALDDTLRLGGVDVILVDAQVHRIAAAAKALALALPAAL